MLAATTTSCRLRQDYTLIQLLTSATQCSGCGQVGRRFPILSPRHQDNRRVGILVHILNRLVLPILSMSWAPTTTTARFTVLRMVVVMVLGCPDKSSSFYPVPLPFASRRSLEKGTTSALTG